MITLRHAKRFARNEGGSMVVPFALWVPIIILLLVSTIELGTLAVRHSALERALDQTTRDIRLGSGETYTHAEVKDQICLRARVLPHCGKSLQLEMIELDMKAYTEPDSTADCVDVAKTISPVRGFENGDENAVMFLRACYKYDPVSPSNYLGGTMKADGNGYIGLISTGILVVEPS